MNPTPNESFEQQLGKVYEKVRDYNKKLTTVRGGGNKINDSFELRKDVAKILYKSGRYPSGKYRQHFVNAKAIIDEARRQSPEGYEEVARQLAREPQKGGQSYEGTRDLASTDDIFLSEYDNDDTNFH